MFKILYLSFNAYLIVYIFYSNLFTYEMYVQQIIRKNNKLNSPKVAIDLLMTFSAPIIDSPRYLFQCALLGL